MLNFIKQEIKNEKANITVEKLLNIRALKNINIYLYIIIKK